MGWRVVAKQSLPAKDARQSESSVAANLLPHHFPSFQLIEPISSSFIKALSAGTFDLCFDRAIRHILLLDLIFKELFP
jgi:hypothetical protein